MCHYAFRLQGFNTDFVCWRGVLTKIAATPYDRGQRCEGWKIAVVKYRGTHYMREYDTELRVKAERNKTDREREMAYWGFKFEQYLCAGRFFIM